MKTTLPGYKHLSVLLLALTLGFWALPAKAQTYGNEWIVPSQTYYKIGTTQNGIHRLTYDWLTNNIPGISAINPQQLKLYRRGQEQSVYVQGEADGTLDAGDFVEFYGQRNDGKLDVNLYKDPQHHVNTYYSMFTDTAAYFLTWSATPGNRMQASSPSTTGLTPELFHIQKTTPFETWETNSSGVPTLNSLRWPHSYQRGRKYQAMDDLQHSYGDESENFGFRSMTSSQGSSRRFIIDSLMSVPTGADTIGLPKPVLRLVISGNSEIQHAYDVRAGRSNSALRVIAGPLLLGSWEQTILEIPINFRDISEPAGATPSRLWVQVRPQASTGTIRLVFATLTYPQTFDLAGKPRLIYPDPNEAVSLIRVANPPGNAIAYDLTNLSGIKRISGTDAGNGQTDFVFENTHSAGSENKMLIASADLFLTPISVKPAAFGNISAADRDYIIISHKVLMQPAQGSPNPVDEFAQYRATPQGGNYKPVIAEMSHVVDQFHYGELSAYSIRNYIDYMKANSALKMTFLIGKGLELGFDNGSCNGGLPVRIVGTCLEKNLVPTFGFPASDLAYVMNFRANDFHVTAPIGRIAAQTPDQVLDYLMKVQGNEALPENLVWRKNILHLVGGKTPAEMQVLLALMNQYKAIAQGLQLGGNVITRNKTSFVDPVQVINVSEEVNAGVSLISYFGHAAQTVTDLDIGFASDPSKGYNNINKYPAMIMAGCVTGNAYTGDNSPAIDSFGEDWTLTKDKGSLSFIAHTSLGTIADYDRYMRGFYKAAYQDSTYGHPIGQVQQQTIANALASTSNPLPSLIALIMQMNLQGDPAVVLYGPQKPDYAINQHPVTLTNPAGNLITADAPTLRLTIPIRNLGRALPDSISVSVRRILPNSSDTTNTFKIPGIFYADTAYFDFPGGGPDAFGLNTFEIWVDNIEQFSEIDELNNKITFEYFVPLSGVAALFPYNFSIVPTQQVTLKGQAFNILTVAENYIFEIDTTHYFNSGWKKTSPVITADLLATWNVDLLPSAPANDSVVYFWRVRFSDLAPGEAPLWSTSSFTYIPGSPTGWSQSHLGQFSQDRQIGISQDSATRIWEFEKLELELRLGAGGGNLNVDPNHGIFTNGQDHSGWQPGFTPCLTNGEPRVMAAVFHPLTLNVITTLAPAYLCGTENLYYTFPDMNTQAGQDALAGLLNVVPNGYYIALMTVDEINYGTLSATLTQALESIGATMITTSGTSLVTGAAYTIVAKKGDPAFAAQEHTADTTSATPVADQTIVNTTIITGARTPGSLTSTILGPAYEWGTLYHDLKQVQASDSVNLKVLVRGLAGTDSVYYNSVTSDVFNLAAINANVYPYLRLQLSVNDTLDVSPAQLKRWLVTYTPAPEGIIRPDINGLASYTMGTFEAGQQVSIDFKFQNISDVTFRDTVKAVWSHFADGILVNSDTITLSKIQPDVIESFPVTIQTAGLAENNMVRVFVNPMLQPEQYYTNNVLEATFKVRQDNLHPIIDVVFDGEHIMDGDIVAPDPTITISLKDENKFLFKDDTVGIEVFLIRGENGPPQRITLVNNPEIALTPATANSDFRIVFEPKNLENGMYTLLVQGADKTGNLAAAEPYKIRFEVINESSITHFYPYPNPFSNSCKFVYTLTGSQIPNQMKIQILTMTGKVVREITRDELGQIRIGVNGNRSTDFSWDGTDEYGDKLANGVYLYRVVIGNKGSDFEHRNTAADKAFKKDYGKLYILR